MKNRILAGIILLLIITIVVGYVWFDKKIENLSSQQTIATIGSEKITEQELIDELMRLYGQETLNEMINKKVIHMAADKYGIKASKDEIDRQYNEFKKDYDSEEDFIEYLRDEMGWTKEELYSYIEYYLLWEEIAIKDVNIPEEELKKYYNDNLAKYKEPTKFHLEQIIVSTKEEAEQVINEVNNGSDFNTLAKERSLDVFSLGNGGDLGMVSEDDPTIDSAIFAKADKMNINDMSIVKLNEREGYAVIRLLNKIEPIQYSFENVKNEIRRELALNQVYSLPEVLEQLKIEMNVSITEPSFKQQD